MGHGFTQSNVEMKLYKRDGFVVLESPEINGISSFEMTMTPDQAKHLANRLMIWAGSAMPMIGKGASQA